MVFSCDIDNSGDALADLQAQPEFWGASGCPTAALGDQASRKHAGARMHPNQNPNPYPYLILTLTLNPYPKPEPEPEP